MGGSKIHGPFAKLIRNGNAPQQIFGMSIYSTNYGKPKFPPNAETGGDNWQNLSKSESVVQGLVKFSGV